MPKLNNFASVNGNAAQTVSRLFASLRNIDQDSSLRGKEVQESVYSQESDDRLASVYMNTHQTLRSFIDEAIRESAIAETNGLAFESADLDLAAQAGMLFSGANPQSGFSTLRKPSDATQVIGSAVDTNSQGRVLSQESYNEADITKFQKASIVYSLLASQQTKWAKAFFPAIAIDANQMGIETPVTVQLIYNEYYHAVNGDLAVTGRKLSIRGYVSPKIFHNRLTNLVPVFRDDNQGDVTNFVDEAKHPVHQEDLGGGVVVNTNYLVPGKEINLIGISQTNQSINRGLAGHTRTIGPAVKLKQILVEIGDDVFEISTKGLIGHAFTSTRTNDSRRVSLDFETDSIVIPAGMLNNEGEESANDLLAEHNIRLSTHLSGSVLLDTGKTRINNANFTLHSATTKDGTLVEEDVFEQIKAIVEDAEFIGYKLEAGLENLDLAQNGILTEEKTYKLLVTVPWKDPVSNTSTTYDNNFDFEGTLAGLINIHRMKADGDTLQKLHDHAELLANYRPVLDKEGFAPMIDSVGTRSGIIPTFFEADVDVNELVDSTRSANRMEDIKAAFLNYIHFIAVNLNRDSQFSVVGRAVTGNEEFKPKVLVLTDQVLHSYLSTEFGTEIKHKEYEIEFHMTENETMEDLVYIALTDPNPDAVQGILSPTVFGNFLQSPEMVSNLHKSVDGQTSRYLTATPRYEPVINVDVLARLNVSGIEKLSEKYRYAVDAIVEEKQDDTNTTTNDGNNTLNP